jgi:hypothetical protein
MRRSCPSGADISCQEPIDITLITVFVIGDRLSERLGMPNLNLIETQHTPLHKQTKRGPPAASNKLKGT